MLLSISELPAQRRESIREIQLCTPAARQFLPPSSICQNLYIQVKNLPFPLFYTNKSQGDAIKIH